MEWLERYSVSEWCLRGDELADRFAMAREAGIQAVGLTFRSVDEAGGPSLVRELLQRFGLKVGLMLGLTVFEVGIECETVLARVAAAQELGAAAIHTITGPLDGRSITAADGQVRRWLEQYGPVAADRGVALSLEPVFPLMRSATYVHTLRHALDLTADIPGAGVLVDTGHLWWDRHLLRDFEANVEHITFVQLDDLDRQALDEYRYERVQLGGGALDLAELVRHFEASGYRGGYENEVLARVPSSERVDWLRSGRAWFQRLKGPG